MSEELKSCDLIELAKKSGAEQASEGIFYMTINDLARFAHHLNRRAEAAQDKGGEDCKCKNPVHDCDEQENCKVRAKLHGVRILQKQQEPIARVTRLLPTERAEVMGYQLGGLQVGMALYTRPSMMVEKEDTARFDWFFGQTDKVDWINTYMQGMREKWTPGQWRAAIDAALSRIDKEPTNG